MSNEIIDQEQDFEQSMSDHGSPEGSNLPVDEGSDNEELENAELENEGSDNEELENAELANNN